MLFCERRKIEMLAFFPLINLAVLVVVLLVLLLRKPAGSAATEDPRLAQLLAADLPGTLTRSEARGESLDRHLRDELAQLRSENAAGSAALRTEIVGNINALGATLREGLDRF